MSGVKIYSPGVAVAVAVNQLLTPDILRPARYLGNELGAVHKPWDGAIARWVLTYPEVYEVGASNLGHIILYSILNAQPRQLCDRAYLPAPDLATKLRETQTPLFAVEGKRSLLDYDILGFSLSYELGATNILEMLDLAQIPLTWQERDGAGVWRVEGGSYPLVFAGGQTATSNPEPYADFFDFIALGDGEELLPEIGLVIEEGKQAGLSREALLLDLAQVPGVYVPRFYDLQPDGSVLPNRSDVPERVLRRVSAPMPHYSIGLVPFVETVHDRLTIEIRRGCTRGCRFCQPGMLTRPARDVEPEQVMEAIEQGMRATGYSEFSLLSLSCSDYLSLPAVGVELRNRLKDENITLSLPSQRVDRFDENIAHILGGTRQSSLTFAPEAGTQRLRDIVNKGLTNEELLRGVKTAYDQGWDRVKLYFMIGLPGETDVDVLGIAETMRWLQQHCSSKGRRAIAFNVTISNFTPKPHTPFQWHSVSTAEFKRKQDLLRAAFRELRGIKANFTDVRISAMEDFVGRGDRRLSSVIKRAWQLGAGMDAWWESLDRAFSAWTEAIAEANLTGKYRQVESGNLFQTEAQQALDTDEAQRLAIQALDTPLPWDHIDSGIDKAWLQKDLQLALAAAVVPDCSFEGCSHCGVCGTDFGHNIVIPPPPIPAIAGTFVPNQMRSQRMRVWLGKLGQMALTSHLDLVRLFDRAVRRAALPIAFTGGFHPSPRIAPANALSLGVTSSGEIVDFDLTQPMEPAVFQQQFAAQLPAEMPIYRVEALPGVGPEGQVPLSVTQLLERAEYGVAIAAAELDWQALVQSLLKTQEIWVEQTTKSGKMKQVNLRDRLFQLELLSGTAADELRQYLPQFVSESLSDVVLLRYQGSCRNDGTMLRPEHLVQMLEQVSGTELQLRHSHRWQLILAEHCEM